MLPSLFDPDLKKQWAKVRLDELAAYAAWVGESRCPVITAEDDLENGRYVIRIDHRHDLAATQAALIAGDFICNLSACLDHLAWQLVYCGAARPGNKTSFPICAVNDSETRKLISKRTEGMPPDAVAIVQSLQPYHAGNGYKSAHLWRLHTLWNIDKHRHLTTHTILPDWQFRTTNLESIESEQISDCTIMRMPLADKQKVEFNLDCKARWTIRERDIEVDLTIEDLTKMYHFVADTVLPSFARFFPKPHEKGGM